MDKVVFVKPVKGLRVRMPRSLAVLPEAGASVPLVGQDGNYWRRRLRDESIVIAKQDSKESEKDLGKKKEKKSGGK